MSDKLSQLAEAYQGMTANEIAEHALFLAAVIEAQDKLIASFAIAVPSLERIRDDLIGALANTVGVWRQIHSLNSVGRKREARELLAKSITAVQGFVYLGPPQETMPEDVYLPAEARWPSLYNPKGD